MVTLKVQRWPIPDYFMAYFLPHPEGNANIYRTTHSSQPGPTGITTLPPATVRRHCTCLPAAHLQPFSPIKNPQRSQIISNHTQYSSARLPCHIYVLLENLLNFIDFFLIFFVYFWNQTGLFSYELWVLMLGLCCFKAANVSQWKSMIILLFWNIFHLKKDWTSVHLAGHLSHSHPLKLLFIIRSLKYV